MKIIVRTPNWLGDCIMSLPVFAKLKKKYPKTEIVAACRDNVKDVFIASSDITRVVSAPVKKCSYKDYFESIKNLRKEKFDIGILLTNSIGTAAWFFLGGVKKRIGFARDYRSFLLTEAIEPSREILAVHQAVYYLYTLKSLGINAELSNPQLMIKEEGIKEAEKVISNMGLSAKKYIVIAPMSAYGGVKDWGNQNYGRVAEMITKLGLDVLITGTGTQYEAIEKISVYNDKIHNMAGKVSLAGFMGILRKCAVYLGGDSGGAHTAAALDVPTISIFGITEPSRTRALGRRVVIMGDGGMVTPNLRNPEVVAAARAALDVITPEVIFTEIEKLLNKGRYDSQNCN